MRKAGNISARRMGERQIFALRKDGEEFPAEATISKLNLQGQAIYTVVLRDVTERHRVAEEFLRAKVVFDKVVVRLGGSCVRPVRV